MNYPSYRGTQDDALPPHGKNTVFVAPINGRYANDPTPENIKYAYLKKVLTPQSYGRNTLSNAWKK